MSSRQFNLPLLPGFSFNPSVGKEYFGKKQHFSLMKNICVMSDVKGNHQRPPSLYSSGLAPDIPSWLLFDKQILTFDANFQNDPMPGGIENINRPVKILFYLEDNTMKVVEPKTDNSGLYQGTIVGRQRILLPNSDSEYFEVVDLNVGNDIEIYGKKFTIMNCDKFTRSFLNKLGVRVPEPLILENNDVDMKRCFETKCKITSESRDMKSSIQFFEFDRKILRFIGYWDNRETEHGEFHHLEILYYLADDTIEIREMFPEKSKKDRNAVFLKRCVLPKKMPECMVATHGCPTDTYSPSDLSIGAPLNVYGRLVMLTDCDQFTKEYYRSKYGIDTFEAILPPESLIKPKSVRMVPRQLPPWNGIGSHEDSAGNCNTIAPKAPHCDFTKFLKKDSIGENSHILRFSARLLTDIPENDVRRFILSYYLRDDTISVFEIQIRNSGFKGGMFYKRNSVMMPGESDFATLRHPSCYTLQDVWTGNVLTVNNHQFLLANADKYTLEYMEKNSVEFPKSNITLIMDKIRNKLLSKENYYKEFVANNLGFLDCDNRDLMPIRCFEQALKEIAGELLTEHEFVTVARFFKLEKKVYKDRESIRSLVNAYLERNLWQDNVRLLEHFKYLDEDSFGFLSRKQIYHILQANRLPIPNDLLEEMLDVIETSEDNHLNYEDVMDFLNFKLKPAKKFIANPAKSTKQLQNFLPANIIAEFSQEDALINWNEFIRQLNLEYTLNEKP